MNPIENKKAVNKKEKACYLAGMGCQRLTYELKTVYRAGVAGATHEEKVSRQNLKTTVDTGNFYYGARYYDPKISVWLSVDAMASKGPNITPYAFSHNNPVMLVDPDGNWPNPTSLSSWYTAVFKSAATQMAQHKFNEMKDRTAAARGYNTNIRLAAQQSITVTGSSMKSKIQLADGRSFDEVSGTTAYNLAGEQGKAEFRGHRKNSYNLYNVTSIEFDAGKEGKGTSGGGFGKNGFLIELGNSNNTVATMLLDSKQDFLDIKKSYYQSIESQFNAMLEDIPMVKDYANNVYPAFEAANNFHMNTTDWSQANKDKYQQLLNAYNQALHNFNRRWNETE